MPDVVGFGEKVTRVCRLNDANDRQAPTSRSGLTRWLGLKDGALRTRYGQPVPNLTASLERAVIMALGFGPSEADFAENGADTWSQWNNKWGEIWQKGQPLEFARRLEEDGSFCPRPPNDYRLAALLPRIRQSKGDAGAAEVASSTEQIVNPASVTDAYHPEGRYLDRLASIQVVWESDEPRSCRLLATCTFGIVEVPTEDANYLVSINQCRAEVLLRESSFEPKFEKDTIDSRSQPIVQLKMEREYSRLNHPSWRLSNPRSKSQLRGEYLNIELGSASGQISSEDEASLLVHKAGFAVSALSRPELEEGGILSSLLKYLVTEHVGEIEQRGSYLYHLSAGPILLRGEHD